MLIRRVGVRATLLPGGAVIGGGLRRAGRHPRSDALFHRLFAVGSGLHPARHRAGHLSSHPLLSAAPISPSGFISPSAAWAAWRARRSIFSPRRSAAAGAISGSFPARLCSGGGDPERAAGGHHNRSVAERRRDRRDHPRKLERRGRAARPRNSPSWPPPIASF